jgi:ABC-type glycerol-3-phosphate transport system substrate-binding protein
MQGRSKLLIAAMSALMVLLAACGGNGSTPSNSAAGKTLVVDHAYAWDFSKDNDPSRLQAR